MVLLKLICFVRGVAVSIMQFGRRRRIGPRDRNVMFEWAQIDSERRVTPQRSIERFARRILDHVVRDRLGRLGRLGWLGWLGWLGCRIYPAIQPGTFNTGRIVRIDRFGRVGRSDRTVAHADRAFIGRRVVRYTWRRRCE